MDFGDGRDNGQAESEAVMGRAVAEPLERLEDAVGIRRADDRAGIGHGQLAASAGPNPPVALGAGQFAGSANRGKSARYTCGAYERLNCTMYS